MWRRFVEYISIVIITNWFAPRWLQALNLRTCRFQFLQQALRNFGACSLATPFLTLLTFARVTSCIKDANFWCNNPFWHPCDSNFYMDLAPHAPWKTLRLPSAAWSTGRTSDRKLTGHAVGKRVVNICWMGKKIWCVWLSCKFQFLILPFILKGPICHVNVFGRHIFVLNTYEGMMDLLERRSTNYSERPHSLMVYDM